MPKERLGYSSAFSALSSRGIKYMDVFYVKSNGWAERKLWKEGGMRGGKHCSTALLWRRINAGAGEHLHSSMTSQPSAVLATSKKDALSMVIYTNNQIPKFTGVFLPFMCCLWCCSLPVQVEQQPWPKAWSQSPALQWLSQLWVAPAGWHGSKRHIKTHPGHGKYL